MPKGPEEDIYNIVMACLVNLNNSADITTAKSKFKALLQAIETNPDNNAAYHLFVRDEWHQIKESQPSKVELKYGTSPNNESILLLYFENKLINPNEQ